MTPHYQDPTVQLWHGDCLNILRGIPDASVDAVVTDPPAGIRFMLRSWDTDHGGRDQFVAWLSERLSECFRVMKPGAHAVVWAIPRTSGWTQRAIEDAGLIPRDCLVHLFGQGFPKSRNLPGGIGTSLKPASEHWWLARKPLEGTVDATVARYGTGGLQIDACRIDASPRRATATPECVLSGMLSVCDLAPGAAPRPPTPASVDSDAPGYSRRANGTRPGPSLATANTAASPSPGTVPTADSVLATVPTSSDAWTVQAAASAASLCASCATAIAQSGALTKRGHPALSLLGLVSTRSSSETILSHSLALVAEAMERSGTTSTTDALTTSFGYAAAVISTYTTLASPRDTSGSDPTNQPRSFYSPKAGTAERPRVNGVSHPTTKSVALMRWLVRLVTPPGGTVLDPFAGSGTTGEACILEGFNCILIEREAEYLPLIVQRVQRRRDPVAAVRAAGEDGGLFDLLDVDPEGKTAAPKGRPLIISKSEDSTGILGNGLNGSREDPAGTTQGRWPTNVVLDRAAADTLDQQSGETRDGTAVQRNGGGQRIFNTGDGLIRGDAGYGGEGGASRFFPVFDTDNDTP